MSWLTGTWFVPRGGTGGGGGGGGRHGDYFPASVRIERRPEEPQLTEIEAIALAIALAGIRWLGFKTAERPTGVQHKGAVPC